MLYVATVHYRSPAWIEIQARYLREHIRVPYQVWTSLEGIDPSYATHFDRVIDQSGRHSDKLNHLAIEIAGEAADSDLLMFLDGDAFPIADPMPKIDEALAQAKLLAVRRAENVSDQQPHPCFCVTTVGAWRSLPGDWSAGYRWPDGLGRRVSDVGGNLLRELEITGTPWVQLLRSNRNNLDALFFAVYGGIVYHHGAGFRGGEFTRAHYELAPKPAQLPSQPLLRHLARRRNRSRRRAWERRTRREQALQSQRLMDMIRQGRSDWLGELI